MLEQLLNDHRALRVTADSLRQLLKAEVKPVGDALAKARWTLTRQMLRHIALENAMMAASGDDPFVRHYRDHVTRWTADRIHAEWVSFRRELGRILDTLEERMDREEDEYYRPRLRSLQ